MSIKESLKSLHEAAIKSALRLVKSADCSASDLKVAWQILMDNNVPLENMRQELGIGFGTPEEASEEQSLLDDLPPTNRVVERTVKTIG